MTRDILQSLAKDLSKYNNLELLIENICDNGNSKHKLKYHKESIVELIRESGIDGADFAQFDGSEFIETIGAQSDNSKLVRIAYNLYQLITMEFNKELKIIFDEIFDEKQSMLDQNENIQISLLYAFYNFCISQ